jgi:hypothetical protein
MSGYGLPVTYESRGTGGRSSIRSVPARSISIVRPPRGLVARVLTLNGSIDRSTLRSIPRALPPLPPPPPRPICRPSRAPAARRVVPSTLTLEP